MRLFTRLFSALAASCLLALLSHAAYAQNTPAPAPKPAPPHITKPSSGPRYAWRNVEIGGGGGFVDGILFHPKQADLIYCRTDIGGVYRWDAKLSRWIALTDWVGQDNGNLRGGESIAVDPTDPNRVYVAAGTYSRPEMKTAILSSTDQGRTWKQSPLSIEMGGNEDGRGMGERLAVDPNHPSTLYFGSRHDGLWKSDDYAATWKKVDSFPAVADNPAPTPGSGFRFAPRGFAGVCWVVFDPSSGQKGQQTPVIYAGVAAPTMPTLWESKDAGASWQPVPGAPASIMPHHAVLDSDGTLYLSYSNGIGPNGVTNGAVWKLNTKSGAWTDISPIKATSDSPGGFGGLALDAKHPGTVMVATLDHWHPADEIYRTTDGGAHWAAISPTTTLDPTTAPWLYWGNAQPRFGWWFAALAIDPIHTGRVLYGTGATIWGTDDITPADTGHATQWRMYAEGVEETAVTALISPPAGPHLISGLGDIGGFTHHDLAVSPPEGMSSNPIFTTTSSLDYAELNPSVVVRAGTGSDANVKSGSKHGAYSLNGGNTWTPFPTEPSGSRGGGTVVVTADGNMILWAAQGAAVSFSKDHGATWSACTGLPMPDPNSPRSYFGQVRLRLLADRTNPEKVYALSGANGKMYVSTDGGQSFVSADTTGLPTGVTSLVAVPGVNGDLWATVGDNGLYLSTDSGAAFTKVESVKTADGLGLGKSPPGAGWVTLFLIGTPSAAGAVHGIYRSDDSGAHWIRINDDQTQYGWIGLPVVGDPRVYGRVYVGTNGRGIIVGDPMK
jgi:photosystem II stability/assembly factor-like uncharacterized protein